MGTTTPSRVEAVRKFSRFYTKQIGLLEEGLLESPYSLPEARVIYELAHHDHPSVTELAEDLAIDPGYLSRILRRLEKRGLLERQRSPDDRRRYHLSLSPDGQKAFLALDERSRAQIRRMLGTLPPIRQVRVVEAMRTVQESLSEPVSPRDHFTLRPHRPGDIGWVVQRHGELYHELRGWDETFDALVAELCAAFVSDYDPTCERCWIAEVHGERVGSVFLARRSAEVGQLRMLLVEPWARGRGIGRRLVGECVSYARHVGYHRIVLYTSRGLDAARRLYEAEGFHMVSEDAEEAWGATHYAQWWALDL